MGGKERALRRPPTRPPAARPKSDEHQSDASEGNADPEPAHGVVATEALQQLRERYPGKMQQPRCKHETNRIPKTEIAFLHLDTVGMTMKQRKSANRRSTDPWCRAPGARDQAAEEDDGDDDSPLDEGKRHAENSERAAHSHHRHEPQGGCPDHAAANLTGPDPDRNHGELMVEPEEGVCKAGAKAIEHSRNHGLISRSEVVGGGRAGRRR